MIVHLKIYKSHREENRPRTLFEGPIPKPGKAGTWKHLRERFTYGSKKSSMGKAILFLDQQSLGLRPFLEGKGLEIRDVTEILGHKDTREGVPDEKIIEYLKYHPYTLVTKDRRLAKQCERLNLRVIYVDESEAVANEVLRRIAK